MKYKFILFLPGYLKAQVLPKIWAGLLDDCGSRIS